MKNKHPKGLLFLFFTEMWERFGYYLIIGIFVLYMIDPTTTGGLAFSDKHADDIFGSFIALTYLTPFLGGYMADRYLGYFKSVYLGGTLMGLGYIGLGFQDLTTFYISMALIVIGNGFFKPSISTLVGNLYTDEKYIANKDAGYNIFYMGINIGAFLCNIIAAFMRNQYGWSAAFITAGIGMFLGLIIFTLGRKHLEHANITKPVQEGDISLASILGKVFLPAIICGAIGWIIPGNIFKSDSTDAFIFACIPVIIFYVSLYLKANSEDKRPLGALLAIFAVGMLFWAVFKQNGTALTRWANYYTDRQVTGSTEKVLSSIYLVDQKDFATKEVQKYDHQFQAQKDENGDPIKTQGKDVYFQNEAPEKLAELEKNPNQKISLINTELFQSVNPGWIILLTPVVVGFFVMLRRKNREPSTPSKIVLGLFISSLSCLVMVAAVYAGSNGSIKVSPLWLVGTYGVITIGELCLSPMGLSIVSKLAPPRLTALMMGGFFLSISIGNKLSGVLASMWYDYENKANFFIVNILLLLFATILGLSILKKLNAVMKEKGMN
ncbi:MFS transporter [Flavobacterium columnare]|uniref:Proton-dependent peptide transporter n=1 Tax=Flavobacterium columnare (strain ATCC 49512 / CIP 103533 / TG 44/87) TaxID=1041826 RepID=G8X6U3_FLACA|nr:peptide MFS transporter [Flavobacterium columnare]AEW85678.1 proton-dependent peptide transporter [Flavobacterium columnare ATCC 49512]ANO47387.1 proton-dependent peptide transporter [Flavobacterium columnare]APT21960.1 MFS transporter [Flavobacterium columnare]MBF6655946.1 MFS transporter [Flavobacterium columnare]MBF6657596.1 MFS transporter [Flavobacterium columnare]